MALENYRDLSTSGADFNAGFQFEFRCANCSRKWKSPFKPYRVGQLAGILANFAFLLSSSARTASRATGNVAGMGSRGARSAALAEAMAKAETMFTDCPSCGNTVCNDCYSERDHACTACVERARSEKEVAASRQAGAAQDPKALACPNCSTPSQGGRFCAECGYDMASTHKSCPSCGVMLPRQARFCTDCGHGF